MKKPTTTQSAHVSQAARDAKRRERFLSKTHSNGSIHRFVVEALKYLNPDQVEELLKIIMQFASSARHLKDGIVTAEELIRVFTKDASQGAVISSLASETYEQSSFHFTPLSQGNSREVIQAAKDGIALELQRKLTMLFSEKLGTEVKRIVEQKPQGASREIFLPRERKDAIRKSTYGKQPREQEMSDKVQDAIRKGISAGQFIRQEMIIPSGQKQEDIAERIKVHQASLSYVLNGKTSLSPEMAAKLSRHFQTYSTQDLLTLQAAHDAKKADQALHLASLQKKDEPTPV